MTDRDDRSALEYVRSRRDLGRVSEFVRVGDAWGILKYSVRTGSGHYLLISADGRSSYTGDLCRRLEAVRRGGIVTNEAVDCGRCLNGRAFLLLTWVEGVSAGKVLPGFDPEQQRCLGDAAGKLLRRIHDCSAEGAAAVPGARIDAVMQRYDPVEAGRFVHAKVFYDFVMDNADEITAGVKARDESRAGAGCAAESKAGDAAGAGIGFAEDPKASAASLDRTVMLHGDFRPDNLILAGAGRSEPSAIQPVPIDWVPDAFGDAAEDFVRAHAAAGASPVFAAAQVRGYWGGDVPEWFWRRLRSYTALHQLEIIGWRGMTRDHDSFVERQHDSIMYYYDGMRELIPTWFGRKTK